MSPIKNEPLITAHTTDRPEVPTPLRSSIPLSIGQNSPLLQFSSKPSSVQSSLEKPKNLTSSEDASLLSFERHELSAGNATLMANNDDDNNGDYQITTIKNFSSNKAASNSLFVPSITNTNADWSYFVTVGQEIQKSTSKLSSSSSSSSLSSSNSDHGNSQLQQHVGGVEFFINGDPQNTSTRKFDKFKFLIQSFLSSIPSLISPNCSTSYTSIRFTNTTRRFCCNKSKTCG